VIPEDARVVWQVGTELACHAERDEIDPVHLRPHPYEFYLYCAI
jgi:hypothetical protein